MSTAAWVFLAWGTMQSLISLAFLTLLAIEEGRTIELTKQVVELCKGIDRLNRRMLNYGLHTDRRNDEYSS